MDLNLSPEQAAIFRLLDETDQNYFITGKAGTGKSVLLQYFVQNSSKNIAVTAPTGVAAINVGGQTIHSFFGLELDIQDVRKTSEVVKIPSRRKKILANIDCLVIDEISMVSADVMDMIDHKLQIARGSNQPFGGCQIIVFGDLYQLPPVVVGDSAKQFLRDHYGTCFFFGAPGIKASKLETVELSHVYRQSDQNFVNILNNIRLGERNPELLEIINERHLDPGTSESCITLCSTNASANRINRQALASIDNEEYIYEGQITGDIADSWLPTEKTLKLKVGALVMITKNDTVGEQRPKPRWVNGSLATICELMNDSIKVKIGNKKYKIPKTTWEKCQYNYDEESKTVEKDIVATFTQFPIKLAYAITIHKSQGQSYDAVKIDLSHGAFAPGQVYVALSRCRSLEHLYLTQALRPRDVIVSPAVVNYMNEHAKIIDDES